MKGKLVIVLDCGATNVRAVAVHSDGSIGAIRALPNATRPDPEYPSGLIWDVNEIWEKFCTCIRTIGKDIDTKQVKAVIVTTFGVNGAPADKDGNLLYPVISWQCQRTVPIMDTIDRYIPLSRLYEISGVNKFSFNTINSLLWLKENRPEVLDRMEGFLFMPSLFIHKMTGRLMNDVTMCGTSMMTDLKTRDFSDEILSGTGLPNRFFQLVETGTPVGELRDEAGREMGLPAGIKVVAGGHDTQLALIGSGAGIDEPVLSSGTWEILMARTHHAGVSEESFRAGFTNELDSLPGLFNTGAQWLASGILEWIKNMFYSKETELSPGDVYRIMVDEAMKVDPCNEKPVFGTDFMAGSGYISGIGLKTSRQQIYRAALEALADKMQTILNKLQHTGKFKAQSLIIVGGGSKNRLWNQLRADRLGIPVKIAGQNETTVLGAALFAHVAIGSYNSIEESISSVCRNYEVTKPENKNSSQKK
ncbi:MAG: L-fuculokinase [Bacteroidales bacterium]|jgi:L-fuculokinase